MSLWHAQPKGFRISNSIDMGYQNHPKYRYFRDGTGRDNYIGINSGGLKQITPIPKGISTGEQMYIGKDQRGGRNDVYPVMGAKYMHYKSDGTGRDTYINISNGGFCPPQTIA